MAFADTQPVTIGDLTFDVRVDGPEHGTPVVLRVESLQMHAAGIAFFQADNGVWLTAHVPANYLRVAE